MLFNEPKLLKSSPATVLNTICGVSVLFNEPKLLKCGVRYGQRAGIGVCFSALQRAEIAEMRLWFVQARRGRRGFSALQRAEIAEI